MSIHNHLSGLWRDSDRVALRDKTTFVTYKSLIEQMESIRASGILPTGTVVSTCIGNTIAGAMVFISIGAAGSAAAPINPDASEKELEFYLQRSPGGLVVERGDTRAERAVNVANRLGLRILCVEVELKGKLHVEMVSGVAARNVNAPNSTCLILFTSGTTGEPKSVPLSHKNLLASAENIVKTYSLTANDITYAVMPFFHIHGLVAALIATLVSGGCVVMPTGGRFSAGIFFGELIDNNCTWFTAVPTMHHILVGLVDDGIESKARLNRHCLRFIRSCSAALAPSLLARVENIFCVPVLEAYAMTEASHQMTSNPVTGPRKPGTVGIPHGSVEICIVDQGGTRLTQGTRGEICVRGPNVTSGYLNNPSANKTAFLPDGFFRTGDEGVLDKDGYLTITGRIKELINRGGEKISPIEIDSALVEHPSVVEAVAFAIPDTKYGEVVGAAVVLKQGANCNQDTIKGFLRGRLAHFKIPSIIYIVKSLPRTATGKIQRRIVAQHCMNSKL